MNEALRHRLEGIAYREHEEDVEAGRRVTFTVCPVCGFAKWISSIETGAGFSVQLLEGGLGNEGPCERCAAAFQRAPEVAKWVLGVVRHAAMMRTPEGKEPKDA